MKKMIRLGILLFSAHCGMYFLLLVQILTILLGINLLLASSQQRALLEEPFAEVLQQEGFYLHERGLASDARVSDQLHGEKEILYFPYYTCNAQYGDALCSTTIVVYEEAFWNSYQPPMQRGSWALPAPTDEEIFCVATSNCPTTEIMIPGSGTALNASGVLGELTYIPFMDSWSSSGGLTENLYHTFDAERADNIYLLMTRTQWDRLGIPAEKLSQGECSIVLFTDISEEERLLNEEILAQNAHPAIALSVLQERAEHARMESIRRYLPLLIALFCITLFGTMCAMAIHTLQDLHTYAIFYLCGMKWKTCTLLHTLQSSFLLVLSLLLCTAACSVIQFSGKAAVLGLRFTSGNLLASLLFCVVVAVLSCLIPRFMIRSRSPITLIRSTRT